VVRAKLTPEGLGLHKEILPIFKKKWNEIMNILKPEEQRQLNRLLRKLSQGLLASIGDPKSKGRHIR